MSASLREFIRANIDATQEHEPDLDQITQRLIDDYHVHIGHAQMSGYTAGITQALGNVLAALGRGVSPSFVVAVVADELNVDLASDSAQ